jgi:hypothetical protein
MPSLRIGEPTTWGESTSLVVEQVFCSSPAANLVGVEDGMAAHLASIVCDAGPIFDQ